jgi:hypothetical protein
MSGIPSSLFVTSSSPGELGLAVYTANVPTTQSVYVVNQTSSTLTGTVTITASRDNPVATVFIQPSMGSARKFVFQTSSTDSLLDVVPNRITFKVYNDSNGTYLVCLGVSASLDIWDFSLLPQQFYEDPSPGWVGSVTGIGFGTGSGTIRVKELLP